MTKDRIDTYIFSKGTKWEQRFSFNSDVSKQIFFSAPFLIAQTNLCCRMPVKKNVSTLLKEKIFSIGFCYEKLSSISGMLMLEWSGKFGQKWIMTCHLWFAAISKQIKIKRCGFCHCREQGWLPKSRAVRTDELTDRQNSNWLTTEWYW